MPGPTGTKAPARESRSGSAGRNKRSRSTATASAPAPSPAFGPGRTATLPAPTVTAAPGPYVARAGDPAKTATSLRHDGLTDSEKDLLNEVRKRLVPANKRSTKIVGVLVESSGRRHELVSGGGQGFSSHVEGKAVAKMKELGITRATLLVEKEPCQICDRSVYPREGGPGAPLRSSRTGKEISRQLSKINSTLPSGSQLTVVDPDAAGHYRGVGSVPSKPRTPGGQGRKKSGPSKSSRPGGTPAAGPSKSSGPGRTPTATGPARAPTSTPKPTTTPAVKPSPRALSAKAAAGRLSSSSRALTAVRLIGVIGRVLSGASAIIDIFKFQSMALGALSGSGFILRKEIKTARRFRKRAARFRSEYTDYSKRVEDLQPDIFEAYVDAEAAAGASIDLWDIYVEVDDWKSEAEETLAEINAVIKEAESKAKIAEAILKDPTSFTAVATMTFGTGVLAEVFAASQDLNTIAGTMRSARKDWLAAKELLDLDHKFLLGWYEELTRVCEAGGECTVFRLFD